MNWEAWASILTVVMVIVALVRSWAGPDTVLLAGLVVMMTLGVFSPTFFPNPAEAVAGFGNEGVVTIAVLFVVATGMSQTGAMAWLAHGLLGRPKSDRSAQMRLLLPVAGMSAFLNNTTIVAMFVPVIQDLCRKAGLTASRLFIPLSYAAILGGSCTLIGTASNIFVHGMVLDAQQASEQAAILGQESELTNLRFDDIHLFSITWIGLPVVLIGVGFIMLTSKWLLPDRTVAAAAENDARRYTVEMLVESNSAIDGQTIEAAGLRHLPDVYLAEIDRDGEAIVAVGPQQKLQGGDRLIFVGLVESVVDLQKIRGLGPATDQVFKLSDPKPNRLLVEAVVSDSCPLIGLSIRDGRFRSTYNAAVIAVHRSGQHIAKKIGDIVLQAGDTLLMETHPRFVEMHRNRRDFFLVSEVADSQPVRHERAWVALLITGLMVVLAGTGVMRLLNAALLASGALVVSGCITMQGARSSINWRVILALGAALGMGLGLTKSGAADYIAGAMLTVVEPLGPTGLLVGIYLLALVFNMLIGAAGAVGIVFPIALNLAMHAAGDASSGAVAMSFTPFAIVLMMAASSSYAAPIYQTNLMVYNAGGYRYTDFMRMGLLLNLIVMAVTVALVQVIWPLG